MSYQFHTIDRPKALNALDTATLVELEQIFGEMERDDAVRVFGKCRCAAPRR